MQPEVRVLSSSEQADWPETLARAAGFTGLDPWVHFVRKVYRFPVYRIASRTGGEITGMLILARVRHAVFGDYLVTAPFGSYGGFAYSSTEARDGLLQRALALADELDVDYVNVRFDAGEATPPGDWIQHPIYATYLADLAPEPEALLQSYRPDHRNHIRKADKKGFGIKFGHLDLLDDTYGILVRSMHELGSPYHSRTYLKDMAESLREDLEFAVVYGPGGGLVGAGVFIIQGGTVTNLHANILRRYRQDYAGEFLYWSAISRYGRQGLCRFDMGRSLIGSGNEVFKLKWKPRKQLLAYWYSLRKLQQLPSLNQKNPRLQFAIRIWKRLPPAVVRWLGPSLIRGLA